VPSAFEPLGEKAACSAMGLRERSATAAGSGPGSAAHNPQTPTAEAVISESQAASGDPPLESPAFATPLARVPSSMSDASPHWLGSLDATSTPSRRVSMAAALDDVV